MKSRPVLVRGRAGAEQPWQHLCCTGRLFSADSTELFGFYQGSQTSLAPLIVPALRPTTAQHSIERSFFTWPPTKHRGTTAEVMSAVHRVGCF